MQNKYASLFLSLILNMILSRVVWAESESTTQFNTYTLCRNQKVVRTIRIEKDKNNWVAYYTKFGVDKEVARAQNLDSSQKVAENIKENLLKANWKCKDLQNVSATVAPAHIANNEN